LGREEVDRMLAGLQAAHDRIAAAMFAADSHPGLALLRAGGLTGMTARRWQAVQPESDALWAQFALLGDVLEQARTLRLRDDAAAWSDLLGLLTQPVIGVDAAGLPAVVTAASALQGAPRPVDQRLGEFTDQLERRANGLVGHLAEVDSACTVLGAQLVPLTTAADGLLPAATGLGEAALAVPLRDKVTATAYELLADPLGAAPGARLSAAAATIIDGLRAQVADAKRRLAELTSLRDGLARRTAELSAAIDAVDAAERAAAEAFAVCREKITDPGLPPPPAAVPVLRLRLAQAIQAGGPGRWAALADDLAGVERAVAQAQGRASELIELGTGLITRRDELRGRLDAYRAKAAALRLIEDDRLARAYRTAQQLLYVQPCDVPAATKAVYAYQNILAELQHPSATAKEPS
jgi:hypothetical protein